MQIPVLDVVLFERAVVQQRAVLHEDRSVLGMHVLQEVLHGPEAVYPVRRSAQEVLQPLIEVRDARGEVHLVESEARKLGSRLQARFALAQAQIVALSGERVREDLRHQLQLFHEVVRPDARCPHRIEAENTGGRRAAHRERNPQRGLDVEPLAVRPVDGSLRRKFLDRGKGHGEACLHLLANPGEVLLTLV